jgi:hypothetical protein
MFDCKRIIYANRICSILEGEKTEVVTPKGSIMTGPICKSLHFFPPEGSPDKSHVVAQFEGGEKKYIYDVDEVVGKDVI